MVTVGFRGDLGAGQMWSGARTQERLSAGPGISRVPAEGCALQPEQSSPASRAVLLAACPL